MGYYVKYRELKSAQTSIRTQISNWNGQLEEVSQKIQAVAEMEEIKGVTANSIRSYLVEVHIPLLQCMKMLMAEYQRQMNEYCKGYYSLDSNSNAQIQQERLEEQIESLNTGVDTFHEIANSVSTAIGLASGLASVSVPSGTRITNSFEQLNKKASKLRSDVGEYEQHHLQSDFRTIEELLGSITEIVQRHSGKSNVTITTYQAGSLSEIPAYQKLQQAVAKQSANLEGIQKELNYKELNAIYWNRADNYFDENWANNEAKLEEALNIIKLETIENNGLDLTSQITQLGYGKENLRLQALIKLSLISQSSMSKDVQITKTEEQKDWKDKALAYLKDSGEQIIKGNYTDKVTLGGTIGEVLLGIVGVDLPMDVRDLIYDVSHFKCNWKCVGMLAIDVVALIPVIGAIKYSDEVIKLGKRWTKNLDEKVEVTADMVSGVVKKAKELFDSGAKKVQPLKASAEAAIAKTSDKISKGTQKAKEILGDLKQKISKGDIKTIPKFKNIGEYYKYISDIGRRTDLSVEEKVKQIQKAYDSLDNKVNVNCPASYKYVKGFDENGRLIYDWPNKLGFDPDSIEAISKDKPLPNQWDRYGSLGGDNFATIPESGIKFTYGERSIPYKLNEAAYHSGSFNNDIYFNAIDAIKNNDLNALNKILSDNNIEVLSKVEYKDIKSSYDAYLKKVADEIGDVDATYGLMGNAAEWVSNGETLMSGGAKQIITPFNGEVLEKLGILIEAK